MRFPSLKKKIRKTTEKCLKRDTLYQSGGPVLELKFISWDVLEPLSYPMNSEKHIQIVRPIAIKTIQLRFYKISWDFVKFLCKSFLEICIPWLKMLLLQNFYKEINKSHLNGFNECWTPENIFMLWDPLSIKTV